MKTDTLIEMLARQAGPAPDFPVGRRLAAAGALGLLLPVVHERLPRDARVHDDHPVPRRGAGAR